MLKSLITWSMTAGCCMLLGGFSGCDRLFDEEEQPEGSYTVSGRLYKGISDVPYANAKLILEGYQRQGFSSEYVDLGSAVTDESGFFSITYDRAFKDGKIGSGSEVKLWFDQTIGGHIATLPWHTNVNHDFAEVGHSNIVVDLRVSEDLNDSLFLYASGIIRGDFATSLMLEGDVRQEVYLVIPPSAIKSDESNFISFTTNRSVSYLSNEAGFIIVFGFNSEDIMNARLSGHIDTIPDDYHRVTGKITGFPNSDTIKLEL